MAVESSAEASCLVKADYLVKGRIVIQLKLKAISR
jgi:hypothetical protein